MTESIFRIVYAYDYIESPNGKPSYERPAVGLLYLRAKVLPPMPELTKLCRIHGPHKFGSDDFVVIATSVTSKYDLTGEEPILNYDDDKEEEI